ncbi:tetratricopeptide repeat protein [Labrys sp. 22185]|uniref:tetratricopeptide repeat protein n=1 Tax=Labrys sp. 22185 TaxID=3453888 RepID=UPI003F8468C5
MADAGGLIARLEQQIISGRDNALARFTLGRARLEQDDPAGAILHLTQAIALKPDYAAAYKQLGAAHAKAGNISAAITVWDKGCAVAQDSGELQALREMTSLLGKLKRLHST